MNYSIAIRILPICLAITLASCGGGGGGDDGSGASPAVGAPVPSAPASADLPVVVDLARRTAFKQLLSPLLAGTFGDSCNTTNAPGQLVPGGGPVIVDAAGAFATSATGSVDLLAQDSYFSLYRYFASSANAQTAVAGVGRRSGVGAITFALTTRDDPVDGPRAFALLSSSGGNNVIAGCGGAVAPLASADLFAAIRRFALDRPVRMLQCVTVAGTTAAVPRAGEVAFGLRDLTVDGLRVGIDDAGKQSEAVLIGERGGGEAIQYVVKWQERDVAVSIDDGGNIRTALISDTGSSPRIVKCERPAR